MRNNSCLLGWSWTKTGQKAWVCPHSNTFFDRHYKVLFKWHWNICRPSINFNYDDQEFNGFYVLQVTCFPVWRRSSPLGQECYLVSRKHSASGPGAQERVVCAFGVQHWASWLAGFHSCKLVVLARIAWLEGILGCLGAEARTFSWPLHMLSRSGVWIGLRSNGRARDSLSLPLLPVHCW